MKEVGKIYRVIERREGIFLVLETAVRDRLRHPSIPVSIIIVLRSDWENLHPGKIVTLYPGSLWDTCSEEM